MPVADQVGDDIRELSGITKLQSEFRGLKRVQADLPSGELAYWTLPRGEAPGLGTKGRVKLLPMRASWYEPNAYLAAIPQPIVMHRRVAALLEDYAWKLFRHYPVENSLARREYGVPMLIGRFDAIVDQQGSIQICELDDVCSLWPALPQLNPIAATYVRALEAQMGKPIYTAELFQYPTGPVVASPRVRQGFARISFSDDSGVDQVAYIPRTQSLTLAILQQDGFHWRESQKPGDRSASYYERILQRFYAHNEDQWHGDIHEAWLLGGQRFSLDDVAVSVRAYRDMPGFIEHMDRFGPRSITMAWNRDSKQSLVDEGLAVRAENLDQAVAFGQAWQRAHPGELLVFKTLHSARTEGTVIFSDRGTKPKGVSSAAQARRKFGSEAAEPIVIQPYKEPDTLAAAGIEFVGEAESGPRRKRADSDRQVIQSVKHIGSDRPGERVVAGLESHFFMIFRSFVVYLPREQRLVHVGGLWQATDGRIVHGGAHSVAGPLYVDGLPAHQSNDRDEAIMRAETLVQAARMR